MCLAAKIYLCPYASTINKFLSKTLPNQPIEKIQFPDYDLTLIGNCKKTTSEHTVSDYLDVEFKKEFEDWQEIAEKDKGNNKKIGWYWFDIGNQQWSMLPFIGIN